MPGKFGTNLYLLGALPGAAPRLDCGDACLDSRVLVGSWLGRVIPVNKKGTRTCLFSERKKRLVRDFELGRIVELFFFRGTD